MDQKEYFDVHEAARAASSDAGLSMSVHRTAKDPHQTLGPHRVGARIRIRGTNGRWSVGSFPPKARALHRTACQSLSNLRISIAPLLDCSDRAPPVPDLPPGLSRASPLSCLRLPSQHRVP